MIPDFSILKEAYPELSAFIPKNWDRSLKDYAGDIYRAPPRFEIEKPLLAAFRRELKRYSLSDQTVEKCLKQLEEKPILQTLHHIGLTSIPRFWGGDFIALAGKPKDDFYLAGTYSGVPFNNSSYSGSLCYRDTPLADIMEEGSSSYHAALRAQQNREKDGRDEKLISLIGSKHRDDLVFGHRADILKPEILNDLTPKIKVLLPEAHEEDFQTFSNQFCTHVQKKILGREDIQYFALHRVVLDYIFDVLEDETHLVHRLFFDQIFIEKVTERFGADWFVTSIQGKKKRKLSPVYVTKDGLVYGKELKPYRSPKELKEILLHERTCPGLFLTFLVLRFLNGFRCFGSFIQNEYIEVYRKHLIDLGLTGLFLDKTEFLPFTSGPIMKNGKDVYALDAYCAGDVFNPQDYLDQPMSFFWEDIYQRLLKSLEKLPNCQS